ncbi:MAG: sensor histidine kinase KdpD [Nitrospirota bacterium]
MPEKDRPDPDALLARINAEEQGKEKGKLKIFFGYAAGVGKTYAMLEAAHRRKAEGLDVVVAYIETHKRPETEAILSDLEVIPRRQIEYKSVTIPEMDTDAVLARAPQVALVDELAHTNAPGSRHLKRYQDVEELLAAGIDVYTTLNVQHLESLNDVVAQITGVVVKETVPDIVIDEASDIELVDIPPEDLLQRLREGKVYVPEQAARAIQKFFQKGNLIALREISLRRTADRVDEQMRAYMDTLSISGPWAAKERLLVLLSGSPFSERLIRTTRRLAEELKSEWFAVYVEPPGNDKFIQENRERVWHYLRLAETLGAKTVTLSGASIADEVINYAKKHNVTKIVTGRPFRSRWKELLRGGAIVDKVIRKSGPIDVYVVSAAPAGKRTHASQGRPQRAETSWKGYLMSLLLVAAATLTGEVVGRFISPTNLIMLYLLVVVLAAVRFGFRPAIAAAFLGVLAFDFFFVPPRYSFAVSDTEYLITFAALFIVGAVIGTLVSRVKSQAEGLKSREVQTSTIYALSRALASAINLDEIANAVVRHVSDNLNAKTVILLPEHGKLNMKAASAGISLDENEKSVAFWAFQNRQAAGRFTHTLRSSNMLYVPLQAAGRIVGVIGVSPIGTDSMSPNQREVLEAFANQAAVAIERGEFVKEAEKAQVTRATEQLERSLLNSISHDLRTPLASITGALSSLKEEGHRLETNARRELIETAMGEADRLNRFVRNLLDMSRIEAGVLKVKKELQEVQDLIGSSLSAVGQLTGSKVSVDVPYGLPLVPMDFVLMTQVLINLLDNALKYSQGDLPVELSARVRGELMEIEVADRGPGIPEEDLQKIFDKFYRVHRPEGVSGTGLGLTICKGIVNAHGGMIRAENRQGGGARFIISLPLSHVEKEAQDA